MPMAVTMAVQCGSCGFARASAARLFERHVEEPRAALKQSEAVPVEADIGHPEAQRTGHFLDSRQRMIDREGHDRGGELGARNLADARHLHRHEARHLLEPDAVSKEQPALYFRDAR